MASVMAAGQLVPAGRIMASRALLEIVQNASETRLREEPALRARLTQVQAVEAMLEGRLEAHALLWKESVTCFEEAGDARSACGSRASLGYAYSLVGALDEAEREHR